MPVNALIFDLDGVIADTAEHHYRSWQRLADEEGLPFNRTDNDQLRGISRRESLKRLLKGKPIDEATAQDWLERKNNYYLNDLNDLTPEPGVPQLLNEARAAGLKLGLASASHNARIVLEKIDLLALFEVVGDGYSVPNNKPAPDLFLWVAGGLHTSPAQAVVFEDSGDGIDTALACGFWTVGVGSANVDHAHLTYPAGLDGVGLADVLAALSTLAAE